MRKFFNLQVNLLSRRGYVTLPRLRHWSVVQYLQSSKDLSYLFFRRKNLESAAFWPGLRIRRTLYNSNCSGRQCEFQIRQIVGLYIRKHLPISFYLRGAFCLQYGILEKIGELFCCRKIFRHDFLMSLSTLFASVFARASLPSSS